MDARYVWKPASPSTDHILKKHTHATIADAGLLRRASNRPPATPPAPRDTVETKKKIKKKLTKKLTFKNSEYDS